MILGRTCAAKIENGIDPFAGIARLCSTLRRSRPQIWNVRFRILVTPRHRYAFRAPARSAQLLRHAGFHAMGLTNNHALDFGATALHDCAARLALENIEAIGVEKEGSEACAPGFFSLHDVKKIALLAISAIDASCEIATASDRAGLSATIANARSEAKFVACLVHWGI